jgi:hypothetical protein
MVIAWNEKILSRQMAVAGISLPAGGFLVLVREFVRERGMGCFECDFPSRERWQSTHPLEEVVQVPEPSSLIVASGSVLTFMIRAHLARKRRG